MNEYMAELTNIADSKYSIAFAKAKHKCGSVVQFYEQETTINDVVKEADTVKLVYTDQNYDNPTDIPKTTPYPNIGGTQPLEDDYLTGNDYIQIVGIVEDGEGGEWNLGAGKKLEDLPQCIAIPLRVDVLPSIANMGYYKSDSGLVEDTIDFKAYVFGGDSPAQTVTWESSSGIIETAVNQKNGVTLATIGTFKPDKKTTAGTATVRAKMYSNITVFGEALVQFIPQIVFECPGFENGYTKGGELKIETWVFAGGTKQDLEVKLSPTPANTDSTTNFNSTTNTLSVGINEDAEYLTLCISYKGTNPFTPPLEPLCIDIYPE